jgi:hypothetical protein
LTFRNLEKHVCSPRWAQRLKEIGVRQDTIFQWTYNEFHHEWSLVRTNYIPDISEIKSPICAAFMIQEFIDIFPRLFRVSRNDDQWRFYCEVIDTHCEEPDNLANVFARILITITKNKNDPKKIGKYK